ncbi:hypothetical protein V2J09_017822, partial [Rumex salicifolius]
SQPHLFLLRFRAVKTPFFKTSYWIHRLRGFFERFSGTFWCTTEAFNIASNFVAFGLRRYSKNISSINGSASNLPDSSGRTFATSFSAQSGAVSPAFHHGGSIQGLHNMHGTFNIQNIPGTLASRNSSIGNVPSGAVQQPAGSLATGRFASNNLPVALSQISHGSSHGHSGVTNRGGIGVSPLLGNAGPRITSSMGSMVGTGNIGRSIGSGGGISVPGLASRINLTGNSGSASLGVQGQNRLMNNVLQQANPQVMSMLGNSYPSAGGPLSQSHVQAVNSLSSMGMLNDVNSSDNSPFDINDFPQLTSRPNSSGGPQGQIGSMRKQGLGVSPIVQQNQEFSIQNEDFPALPGFKGGTNDYGVDLHQKEQLHDNMPMMQSPHFSMGRSAGFSLGGGYSSNRPQQQQQRTPSVSGGSGVSFTPANNQELSHMHGSDMFPSSHPMYHLQSGGAPGIGLRPMNSGNTVSGMSSYDQLMQQYQQQQQNQSQFRLQQMSAVNQSFRDQGMKSMQATQAAPDPYGLLGLLSVIRMSDPDLTSLALGMDLTTLGLNLNSTENLYKTFASPWSDEPIKGEPEFVVPQCFYSLPPPPLNKRFFQKFRTDTLFYIFYSMPKDEAQLYAADELIRRGWMYHRDLRMWLTRVGNMDVLATHPTYERGSFICFDPNAWETVIKENFILQYEAVEKKPNLLQQY